jgi:hypothetical protein
MKIKSLKNIKFILLAFLVLNYLILPNIIFAQKIEEPPIIPEPIFGCESGQSLKGCIGLIAIGILKILLVFAIAAAVIAFAVGGIKFIVQGGSEDQRKKAKDILLWSAVGLVVALLSFSVITAIQNALQKGL